MRLHRLEQHRDSFSGLRAMTWFKHDTEGYLALKKSYPHIASNLDKISLDWTVIPKTFVVNVQVLDALLSEYRENLELLMGPRLEGMSFDEYKGIMEPILEYLENTVRPALEEMNIVAKEKPLMPMEDFNGEDFYDL